MAEPSVEGLKSYQECAKQTLTISAGVMALTVTFWDKLHSHGDKVPLAPTAVVEVSWALFILTDLFALWVLMATTGSLLAFDRKANGNPAAKYDSRVTDKGYVGNVDTPFALMLFVFVAGLACMAFAVV
jgi:hypothetical protein